TSGIFYIALPLTGKPGVECRTEDNSGNHRIIFSFSEAVTIGSASLTGTGSVANVSVDGADVTVDLTGVTNAQTITLTLKNVSAGNNTADVSVSMTVLSGDTNGDYFV